MRLSSVSPIRALISSMDLLACNTWASRSAMARPISSTSALTSGMRESICAILLFETLAVLLSVVYRSWAALILVSRDDFAAL